MNLNLGWPNKVTLDVVRGEGVHVVGVPGVDQQKAGDPPGKSQFLISLLISYLFLALC